MLSFIEGSKIHWPNVSLVQDKLHQIKILLWENRRKFLDQKTATKRENLVKKSAYRFRPNLSPNSKKLAKAVKDVGFW